MPSLSCASAATHLVPGHLRARLRVKGLVDPFAGALAEQDVVLQGEGGAGRSSRHDYLDQGDAETARRCTEPITMNPGRHTWDTWGQSSWWALVV